MIRRYAGDDARHVIVIGDLEAPRRRRLARRRPRSATPGSDLGDVEVTRATVITTDPLPEDGAPAWLDAAVRDHETTVGEALLLLNRTIHGHRLAAMDPYVSEVRAGQALATRIGYGSGEQVAEGHWEAARELPAPRPSRSMLLHPQQRLAALLSGRDVALACEVLALRARARPRPGPRARGRLPAHGRARRGARRARGLARDRGGRHPPRRAPRAPRAGRRGGARRRSRAGSRRSTSRRSRRRWGGSRPRCGRARRACDGRALGGGRRLPLRAAGAGRGRADRGAGGERGGRARGGRRVAGAGPAARVAGAAVRRAGDPRDRDARRLQHDLAGAGAAARRAARDARSRPAPRAGRALEPRAGRSGRRWSRSWRARRSRRCRAWRGRSTSSSSTPTRSAAPTTSALALERSAAGDADRGRQHRARRRGGGRGRATIRGWWGCGGWSRRWRPSLGWWPRGFRPSASRGGTGWCWRWWCEAVGGRGGGANVNGGWVGVGFGCRWRGCAELTMRLNSAHPASGRRGSSHPLLNAQLPGRTARTAPAHEHLAPRRLHARRAQTRQRRRQVDLGVEVGDRAAVVADEVVVRVHARVVADRPPRADPRGEAEVGEQLEAGVDRRQRDARHGPVDPLQHLLGGRVAPSACSALKIARRCGVTRSSRARRAVRISSWAAHIRVA